jgi:hypothetical protein
MTGVSCIPGLRAWVVVSILLHAALLLMPGQFFEVFYPKEKYVLDDGDVGVDISLVSDYEVVDPVLQSERLAEADVLEVVEVEVAGAAEQLPDQDARSAAGEVSDEIVRGGDKIGLGIAEPEPQFFPPVPRYIVPPDLQDLGIRSIRLDIRILVSALGEPLEVVLPDSLGDEELRRRVIRSARRFRFEPARKGDRPVSAWVDLPLVLESTESD